VTFAMYESLLSRGRDGDSMVCGLRTLAGAKEAPSTPLARRTHSDW